MSNSKKIHKKLIKFQNQFGKQNGRNIWLSMKKEINDGSSI